MKIAVIGAGSWGTALAQVLATNGANVGLWARKPEVVKAINAEHRNTRYFPDEELSAGIVATTSYRDTLLRARGVLVVTPSHLLRGVGRALADVVDAEMPVLICSKGAEADTGLLPVAVMEQELGNRDRIAVLSGPNHAEEVIKGQPSASVVACSSPETAVFFRDALANDTFRAYTSDDTVGVELCAAFKNVIAIAVGVSYGLGFGDNTAAMLITRGLAEMSRMVVACGGEALTCMGLAGAGDMVVTCMSRHSRNRRFGEEYVVRGRTLADFEADNHMVVEGALACKTLDVLAREHGVDLPITDTVRAIVWEGADPREAALLLGDRPLTTEFYGL
ncbi:NAD(P)H-dependent glycerol-3-phosphate dehydrogenase [Adlercreutzia faecimuris]|uniref:Glycerol-3-phosphate dehydrogenase [NAD(P)+] n=1 Tax=Adlercreutzia faecimuris TaxID=2897341 RepID=A0ABS9WIJ7_9ACTN|nr:NAD(P)H-dependent glycerol-3-phosphate dehydrogenase [Adlercreutzia sp. JBNU-10]MCI2242703.1 NAD(P)-dependent glycerol-3-phosphate dehydrogenase [Adlercreutzia sp. JBNU-10]